jgi:asparagine synthase (glutamine-hydrolysing)
MRRKKRGFAMNVVDEWFRNSLSAQMTDTLMDSDSMIYQYLQPSAVQRLLREHQSGRNDYHKILFSLMVFEEWLRVHTAFSVEAH